MLTLRMVDKGAWGRAVAAGRLNRAAMVWGGGGSCRWERDGHTIAAMKPGPLGTVHYLASEDIPILVRVPA
jgi:hypothetical protein